MLSVPRQMPRKILCSVFIKILFLESNRRFMQFLFFLLFRTYFALFKEIGQSLISNKVTIAFGQLMLYIFACICVIVLKGSKILLEMMVVIITIGHDGAMKLIMMDFSLFFSFSMNSLSLNTLSFDDFFDALLSLYFILVDTFTYFYYFLFNQFLIAFFYRFLTCKFVFIHLSSQLSEQILIDSFQLFDVCLCIVQKLQFFSLQFFVLCFESFNVELHFIFYLLYKTSYPYSSSQLCLLLLQQFLQLYILFLQFVMLDQFQSYIFQCFEVDLNSFVIICICALLWY